MRWNPSHQRFSALEGPTRSAGHSAEYDNGAQPGRIHRGVHRMARLAGTDTVFVQPSLSTDRAAALALSHRLASLSFVRVVASSGGLLSYAANTRELSRRSADYIDRILRGADPAQLPVEQARSYDLLLNLRTARALGISVPSSLMLRVTEVIE